MSKFEDIEYKLIETHNSEFVDFDETGHGKLKNNPIGAVYASVNDHYKAVMIHSVENVVYNKSLSNKKIQVFYKTIMEAKTLTINAKDYLFELELHS